VRRDWVDGTLRHRFVRLSEVTLHVVESGPETGPAVLLLHGFPELWYSWKHQIPGLVAAGFRVIAPDQRGFALSDKPGHVEDYAIENAVEDARQLLDALGITRAHVVGHDFGGGVAWGLAMLHPERVDRLAILDSPHPLVFAEALAGKGGQASKSWYMQAFRIPLLPEIAFMAFDFALLRWILRTQTERRGAYTPEDIEVYVQGMKQDDAIGASLNWYRALLSRGLDSYATLVKVTEAPVLVIWGVKDGALGVEMAKPPPEWVPQVRIERLPRAGHFVHWDEPRRVSELLVDHFTRAVPVMARTPHAEHEDDDGLFEVERRLSAAPP
jgi:epoxide hydrolase 4